jgi:hypothetical protein
MGCVALLALIAGTVSYLHMHMLVELDGQPGWVAALTPFSVDGMIVAASTTLLAHSRSGGHGGFLPWVLLVVGSVASLAAYVAVAEPTATGRVIAAWPSFALIAAYELLMRQVRPSAGTSQHTRPRLRITLPKGPGQFEQHVPRRPATSHRRRQGPGAQSGVARDLQRQTWQWALATGPGTVRCRVGVRSPGSLLGTSGGAAWSSSRVLQVNSPPQMKTTDQACT